MDAFGSKAYKDVEDYIGKMAEEKNMKVEDVVKLMQDLGTVKQSAFDKYFGEGSKIAQFYQPALTSIEQQILDVTDLLDTLDQDIIESTKDVGISTGQFGLLKGKKAGELAKTLGKLTTAQSRLQAGLDTAILLSDKAYSAAIGQAQDEVNAAIYSLENSGMPEEQISLMKQALQNQFQMDYANAQEQKDISAEIRAQQQAEKEATAKEKKEKQEAFDNAITDVTNFVLEAGYTF